MPSRIPVRDPTFLNRRASAPSKLEQLAASYQRKLHVEKERKLIELYQEETDRAMRMPRSYGSAGNNLGREQHGMNNGYGGRDRGMVRDFFKERHALQNGNLDNRQYYDNINYHYQKKKTQTHRGPSPGKPPLPNQNRSAGRDKAKPLAPINRYPNQQMDSNGVGDSPKPPVNTRPQLVRSHRRGSQSSGSDSPPIDMYNLPREKALIPIGAKRNIVPAIVTPNNDRENSAGTTSTPSSAGTRYAQWREEQEQNQRLKDERLKLLGGKPSPQMQRKPIGAQPPSPRMQRKQPPVKRSPQMQRKAAIQPPAQKPEKESSFQKWQQEQDKAKEDRLQKYNQKHRSQAQPEYIGYDESDLSSRRTPASQQAVQSDTTPSSSSRRPPSGRTQQKKQALLKQTRPPSSDMEMSDEDDEQAEIRRKQARLEELIEQQKRELDNMRLKRKKEEEKAKQEDEKRKKRLTAERERAKRLQDAEDSDHGSRLSRRSSHPDVSDGYHSNTPSRQGHSHRAPPAYSPAATPVAPSPPVKRKPSLPRRTPVQKPREPTPDNENTAFYLEVAATDGAVADVDLASCPTCGRNFATDRLAKHAKVCQKASKKKRKVYDPVKMRAAGTDYAQYTADAARAKRQKTPVKKNWRTQHENFIQSIRYAKKVTEIESTGGNVADLPPPPPTENPDYKQCPYCSRRFAPMTAERHIPHCKESKSRPAPPKQRRR